jgi:hypothetical protein
MVWEPVAARKQADRFRRHFVRSCNACHLSRYQTDRKTGVTELGPPGLIHSPKEGALCA